ncbi:MAG TPA: signal recognition particle-docking protein FtsY [Dehalococcoidia bacterium]|nr:signal recognition particle-docking protein FtsY [Dehalococcoidia bacterium]
MFSIFKRDRAENKKQTNVGLQRSRERWFGKVWGLLRSSRLDESVWDEIEEILISADVGVETSLGIIQELKSRVKDRRIEDPDLAFDQLKETLAQGFGSNNSSEVWLENDDDPRPYVILMVGVNGVGKTTSIAKLAYHFKRAGKKVVLGAADTFRAAAEEQLEILGQRVGVDVIRHRPGADPGAVAFDAYRAAKARNADVLIIDTAGRLHTKSNLMEELKKVQRVITRLEPTAPHQVLLTLDATTGHNGLAQAQAFKDAVNCTGIFLSKLDGTARGGIALAIQQELQVPILFIGTGESLDDLAPFDARDFVDSLLAPVS